MIPMYINKSGCILKRGISIYTRYNPLAYNPPLSGRKICITHLGYTRNFSSIDYKNISTNKRYIFKKYFI